MFYVFLSSRKADIINGLIFVAVRASVHVIECYWHVHFSRFIEASDCSRWYASVITTGSRITRTPNACHVSVSLSFCSFFSFFERCLKNSTLSTPRGILRACLPARSMYVVLCLACPSLCSAAPKMHFGTLPRYVRFFSAPFRGVPREWE